MNRQTDPLLAIIADAMLDRLVPIIQEVAEAAIPFTKMANAVLGRNVVVAVARLPISFDEDIAVHWRHILPPDGAKFFPLQRGEFKIENDPSYKGVHEKARRLGHEFIRAGHTSAFKSRVEPFQKSLRGKWEGAFVVCDGEYIVMLSGLTGKLDEAVLLTAAEEADFLTHAEAVAYSRPMKPGMLNKPRRDFDYFFEKVYGLREMQLAH